MFSKYGSENPISCPEGSSSPQGSFYWSDCFIDSDLDGASDYEDEYPNYSRDNILFSFGYKFLLICLGLKHLGNRMNQG